MNITSFKIGLMGSSCSGKSTTAKIIAKEFGLELHEEVESILLNNWIQQNRINTKEDLVPSLSKEFQDEALYLREQNSKTLEGFVSDRTAVELLVYNKIYVQPYFSEQYAFTFKDRCYNIMKVYTHLFLFPHAVLPLENNGIRTLNYDYQKKVYDSLLNILNEFSLNYIALSPQKLTITERVNEVKKWLKI